MIPINYPTATTYTPRQKFFIEKVLELLNPDVMDSHRTRVMNPKIILSELSYVLKRFHDNKIKHFKPTIEAVTKEAMDLLSVENELKFCNFSKGHYISVLGQTTENSYIKTRVLTKIISSDNFRYNNDLVTKIANCVANPSIQSDCIYQDYKEIDRLTGYLLTGLINEGFSKEFLQRAILSSFINKPKKTFEEAFGVFHFFSKKQKNKYRVYFKANLPLFATKDVIKNYNVKIHTNAPQLNLRDEKIINVTSSCRYFFFTRAKFDANNELFKENLVKCKGKRTSQDVVFIIFSSLKVKESENPQDFLKEGDSTFICIRVHAHDSVSAVKIAKNELYNLLDLIHLCFISKEIIISDKNLILELDKEENQRQYWYRSFENKIDGSFRGGSHIVEILSKRFGRIWNEDNHIKYESKKKINSSIRYFRLSNEAQEIEHKFLNYWIGLEYLFSNTDDPQSTIDRVKRYLPAIQTNVYVKRLINDLHKNIVRLKATSITDFNQKNTAYLLKELSYDELWDKYYQDLPLISYRARKLADIFFNRNPAKKSSELILLLRSHEKGLKQHLTRIYRLRNEIVHEAAVNIRTDIYTLTSNLKHYLLISLDTMLESLADNYGVNDINSFLIYQEAIYQNIEKTNPDLERIISLNVNTKLID